MKIFRGFGWLVMLVVGLVVNAWRTTITNVPTSGHDSILGQPPEIRYGNNAVDGDAHPWKLLPLGSIYFRRLATAVVGQWHKLKNDGADDDWVGLVQCITETVAVADFTDGGAAVGTYTMAKSIPVGAAVLQTTVIGLTGFTGDTSAVITVGDGTDVDRYNTGTPSVFTTAAALAVGVPSGVREHAAAIAPVLTVTSNADFTAVTAGQLTIRIYYLC